MPAKDPSLYLIHIRECCERILDYTYGIESMWPSVPVVHDAVCRNLEIIGDTKPTRWPSPVANWDWQACL
jgi:uncharacterized protein with HEPN domain